MEQNYGAPQNMGLEAPRKKSSALGCLGIGCLTILVLSVVAGVVLYFKAGDVARNGMALVTEKTAEAMFSELSLPPEDKQEAQQVIQELSSRIRNGEITTEQGVNIMKQVTEGPVAVVVATRVFSAGYLAKSGLSPEAKDAGELEVKRFAYGMAQKQIPKAMAEPIFAILKAEGSSSSKPKFKDSLTDAEVQQCLTVMKEASDRAKLPAEVPPLKLGTALRDALEEGMGATKEQAPPQVPAPPSAPAP